MDGKVCNECGKTFLKNKTVSAKQWMTTQYCSRDCYNKSTRQKWKDPIYKEKHSKFFEANKKQKQKKQCKICDKFFERRSNSKYCSKECVAIFSKNRWKDPRYREKHTKLLAIGRKKASENRTGKTYEQLHGVEKAKEIKERSSISHTGKVGYWKGKKRSPNVGEALRKNKLGRTYEQIHGIEGAKAKREKDRSRRLKQVFPQKDSSIEVICQGQLFDAEIAFEAHKPIHGQPDIFLQAHDKHYKGLAVFIDGCAWHACPLHNRRAVKTPDDVKRASDLSVTNRLFADGYYVLRIWEHDVQAEGFNIVEHVKDVMPIDHLAKS